MLYLHVCCLLLFQVDNTTNTIIFYLKKKKNTHNETMLLDRSYLCSVVFENTISWLPDNFMFKELSSLQKQLHGSKHAKVMTDLTNLY